MVTFGRIVAPSALLVVVLLVSACGADVQAPEPQVYDPRDQAMRDRYGTITGSDGIRIFGTSRAEDETAAGGGGGGLGVNAYLWRGALETLGFMPIQSADPFGGLILTDWYQSIDSPDERLRLQVLIRDAVLRADGVKVSVIRQVHRDGSWLDAPVDPETASIIEDKILTRARELRVAGIQ